MEKTIKALLIVAHGSRRQRSNEEIKQLSACVARQAGSRFAEVRCAFLELAEPSIPEGIDSCIAAGATEVVVMPYFLSAGRHVVEDVPTIVQRKQAEYPDVKICFSTYLGASSVMPQLILETVGTGQCLCGKLQQDCRYPACIQKS